MQWKKIFVPKSPMIFPSFRLKKMFATGTQKRHWMFTGVTEIDQLRVESVERYVNLYGKNMQVSLYPTQNYYLNTF